MTNSQIIERINTRKQRIHNELNIAIEKDDIESIKEFSVRLQEIQNIINLFK